MNRLLLLLIALPLLFLIAVPASYAQNDRSSEREKARYTMVFRGTPLGQALKELVDASEIDLIYNPSLLGERRVYSISRDKTPEEILSDILNDSGLDYIRLSSGTYVIVRSAASEAQYGRLAGIVFDRETGNPLEGANVYLADRSAGSSTGRAGRFTIGPLLNGEYEVTITYVGYRPVRDTVYVPFEAEEPFRFYMDSRPVFVEPVVVSSLQPRLPYRGEAGEEVSRLTESGSFFAGSPDAIRSTNSVMGMQFSLSMADFHIQGGSAGDHRVLLDGVPVYNPVSLGRLTGAFSPYALRKINIRKAGFGAEAGSQLSGIIEVQQDLPGEDESGYLVQFDPLNVNARWDLSASPGNATLKTMIAARTNIWHWYKKPSLSGILKEWDRLDPLLIENLLDNSSAPSSFRPLFHNSDINFYDLHLRSELRYDPFHTTSLSLYRGRNSLQTRLLSHNDNADAGVPDFMYTRDRYDWYNTVGRIRHDWLAGPRLIASAGISVSSHSSNHHFGMSDSDQVSDLPENYEAIADLLGGVVDGQAHRGDRNGLTEWTLETSLDYSLRRNHSIGFGVEARAVDYTFQLSDPFYHPTSTEGQLILLSGFIDDEITLGERTAVTAGTRFTYTPESRTLFAEPRLSLQHEAPQTRLGHLSFRVAGGLYRQFINQFDVTSVGPSAIVPSTRFWVPSDYTTGVPKAYHLQTELLLEPAEHLSLRWEGYYKWHPGILAVDYHALLETPGTSADHFESQANFIVSGRGFSYGSGIRLSQLFESWRMEAALSYQYSVSEQRIPKRFDNRYVETPWNTPHRFTAMVNWNPFGGMVATLRWQSIWGRAWAYKRAYYDYLTIDQNQSRFGPFSVESPADDELSPFHQLDLGLSYRLTPGASSMRLQLDLVNLLDRRNILEKQIAPRPAPGGRSYQIFERRLPGFIPSLGVEWNF